MEKYWGPCHATATKKEKKENLSALYWLGNSFAEASKSACGARYPRCQHDSSHPCAAWVTLTVVKGVFYRHSCGVDHPDQTDAYCLPCTNSLQMFIGFWCLSIPTGLSELLDRPICSWLLRDELGLIPCFLLTRRARSFWEDGNLMNLLKGECMPLWDPGLSCNADMFIWLFVYVLSKQKLFHIASSSFGYVSSQADIA